MALSRQNQTCNDIKTVWLGFLVSNQLAEIKGTSSCLWHCLSRLMTDGKKIYY